eukprot:gnl/Dysnectes_brevis/370_a412_9487.p1 GENE.gnl/Dysnectes_brevis/370_a412_9487~~gnl/Dysnectes_brevis/370_a412_9487.p1  ORF type:complete len:157 (-),score=40.51 gnl/Dysnectes_brevis/370_a412_9487:33-503(-)
MSAAVRRISRDLRTFRNESPEGAYGGPVGSDMMHWSVSFEGPEDTPYCEGVFPLDIKFPPNYPISPPKVVFTKPVFHPNVNYETGQICVDILTSGGDDGSWRPDNTVCHIVVAIANLMRAVSPHSPLNPEAGDLYTSDIDAYNERVEEEVEEHCSE